MTVHCCNCNKALLVVGNKQKTPSDVFWKKQLNEVVSIVGGQFHAECSNHTTVTRARPWKALSTRPTTRCYTCCLIDVFVLLYEWVAWHEITSWVSVAMCTSSSALLPTSAPSMTSYHILHQHILVCQNLKVNNMLLTNAPNVINRNRNNMYHNIIFICPMH